MTDKFWDKVDKTSDCWEWVGYREKTNYGRVSFRGNNKMLTHRVSWILTNGEIPNDLCVLHRCDNPPCVNPEHLFLGTIADNNADRDRKGRWKENGIKGSQHWRSKIDESDVRVIKGLISVGTKQRAIARFFDMSEQAIGDIKAGRRWRHVE